MSQAFDYAKKYFGGFYTDFCHALIQTHIHPSLFAPVCQTFVSAISVDFDVPCQYLVYIDCVCFDAFICFDFLRVSRAFACLGSRACVISDSLCLSLPPPPLSRSSVASFVPSSLVWWGRVSYWCFCFACLRFSCFRFASSCSRLLCFCPCCVCPACLSFSLDLFLSSCLSLCPSVGLSCFPSLPLRLCACQSVSLYVRPSVSFCVCPSLCPYACPSLLPSPGQAAVFAAPARAVSLGRLSVSVGPSLCFSVGPSCCVGLSCCVCPFCCVCLSVCPTPCQSCSLVFPRSSVQPCSSLPVFFLCLAEENKVQNSEDKTWHCKPCCICHNLILSWAGNIPNHPVPCGIGPVRVRRSVGDVGHASWKVCREQGRTLFGQVVSWVSRTRRTVPPSVMHTGKLAGLKSFTQFRVRTDGGTLGPRRYCPGLKFILKFVSRLVRDWTLALHRAAGISNSCPGPPSR